MLPVWHEEHQSALLGAIRTLQIARRQRKQLHITKVTLMQKDYRSPSYGLRSTAHHGHQGAGADGHECAYVDDSVHWTFVDG
jgi:hypothetical protein